MSPTSSTASRILGGAAIACTLAVAWLGLVVTKPDTELGDTVRLLYVHVPVAVVAYLACFVCATGSAVYLWKRSQWWDMVAEASGEIAAVFAVLTIVTGALWGKPTWGSYWVWDARLTTTLMLVLLLCGYLALRRTSYDPEVGAKRAAIVGLLLVPNIIVVNRSVEWWRSLHQDATLLRLDPEIEGLQLFTLIAAIGTGLVVFAWLVVARFRLSWLERQDAAHGLDAALAERRAEATLATPTSGEVAR